MGCSEAPRPWLTSAAGSGRDRGPRPDYRGAVATLEQARAVALALPEVTEGDRHGRLSWAVGRKVFAWERAFSKADIRRYGAEPVPEGPILALAAADLGDKAALLQAHPEFFTIPHFDGYAAVLVRLVDCSPDLLRESLVDAWLTCAPPSLAQAYLADGRAPD
jgi:hypothetical protein